MLDIQNIFWSEHKLSEFLALSPSVGVVFFLAYRLFFFFFISNFCIAFVNIGSHDVEKKTSVFLNNNLKPRFFFIGSVLIANRFKY